MEQPICLTQSIRLVINVFQNTPQRIPMTITLPKINKKAPAYQTDALKHLIVFIR